VYSSPAAAPEVTSFRRWPWLAKLVARRSAEILFVGTARGMESRLVPEAGFNLRLVDVGQLKMYRCSPACARFSRCPAPSSLANA